MGNYGRYAGRDTVPVISPDLSKHTTHQITGTNSHETVNYEKKTRKRETGYATIGSIACQTAANFTNVIPPLSYHFMQHIVIKLTGLAFENFNVLLIMTTKSTLRQYVRKFISVMCFNPVSYTHLTLPTIYSV